MTALLAVLVTSSLNAAEALLIIAAVVFFVAFLFTPPFAKQWPKAAPYSATLIALGLIALALGLLFWA